MVIIEEKKRRVYQFTDVNEALDFCNFYDGTFEPIIMNFQMLYHVTI